MAMKTHRTNLSVVAIDSRLKSKNKVFYLEGQVISILNNQKEKEKEKQKRAYENVYQNFNKKLKTINRSSLISNESNDSSKNNLQETIEE